MQDTQFPDAQSGGLPPRRDDTGSSEEDERHEGLADEGDNIPGGSEAGAPQPPTPTPTQPDPAPDKPGRNDTDEDIDDNGGVDEDTPDAEERRPGRA